MGLLSRVSTIFKSKVNSVLDRAEDPRETLEYSYQRQVEQLQNVRRGVAEVVTSKKRVELELAKLEALAKQYDDDARDAVAAGRDDLATAALTRKQGVTAQIESLKSQVADLEKEEARLLDLQEKLRVQVETFRTKKEVVKAQYAAAQAQVRIGEATTGLGEEMEDVNLALERAQERTEALRARASAIEELSTVKTAAALEAPSTGDDIRDELNRMKSGNSVSEELARLKAEMGKGQLPPAGGEPESGQ
ncbi:PspA/IM30 family protein [Candidatus Hydrogenisulfobacillus filiaventi]|uniref:PspA/IM30 family protein n=1 Tax=Candidatus Hydrogenisulfobacillus filiaventi TaxID=2707344 RepID=A0A6F8ZJU2_9FIRM|nr:PspA/IM30 family protein [Bacillota bacterium]CAB1130151.1 PspA/IM30 family protein [Candidatus Hydrogenisulfobacillus filiaventi]